MYLKRLEMKGFKSFPDKMEIEFDSGVTCVVGPNGSGKSNITDAVRWVLGEQKVKTLRGSKMEDVIFNGTRHRKALNGAEVSLVFENGDRKLGVDYSEVKVTRRIFRSGDNEYLLNDTPCRLKDVRDVFMDTGIGVDGYSIIGQGRIESILSTKNDDRRLVFEEAAGIVKYRQRKREAERKLEAAVQNLLRVEDILKELGLRVGPLEEQSRKASRYLELAGELKTLEVNQMIRDVEAALEQAAVTEVKWRETAAAMEAAQRELSEMAQQAESARSETEADQQLGKELTQLHFQAISQVQELENQLAALQTEAQRAEREQAILTEELENFSGRLDEMSDLLKRLEKEVKEQQEALLATEGDLLQLDEGVQALRGQVQELEQAQNASRDSVIGHLNSIERKRAEIKSLEQLRETMQKRLDQVDHERILELSKEQNKTLDSDGLQTELDEIRSYIENLSHKRQESMALLFGRKTELAGQVEKRDRAGKSITALEAELKILDEMEQNYNGYQDSVRNILKACHTDPQLGTGVHGVVADLLRIPERYETAVDVILGRSLQNIVVDSERDARRLIRHMKEKSLGRATFLPLKQLRDAEDQKGHLDKLQGMEGFIGRASDLVSCDEAFKGLLKYLLDRVVIVESLDHAGAMMQLPWLRYRIVTLEGDVFNPGGAITGGSVKTTKTGLLSRKRRIVEIGVQLETLKQQYSDTLAAMEETERTTHRLERESQDLARVMDEKKLDLARKEEQARQVETDLESAQHNLRKLELEKGRLREELDNTLRRAQQLTLEIEEHEANGQLLETALLEQGAQLAEKQEAHQSLLERQTQMRVLKATQRERLQGTEERIQRERLREQELRHEAETRRRQLEAMNQREADRGERAMTLERDREAAKGAVTELSHRVEAHEQQAGSRRGTWEQLLVAEADLKSRVAVMDERLALCGQEKSRAEARQESLMAALWEKYELSWLEALEMKVEWEESQAQKRMRELRREIRDLGEVNVGAVKEYAEVKERFEFLTEQRTDLLDAEKGLQRIIRDLDKAMRQQFMDSFETVRKTFQEMFSELFGGGTADVILSDPEQPLDCEIHIQAQPPGKKLQSLELMSGGEKSLTAIALLFSILKSKPSPFCMLDEIEAALDDVNVWRFAEFLKHFTQQSQFIVITHRKGTMEIADTLYGVTMEEYGVSRILSVKMEEIPV